MRAKLPCVPNNISGDHAESTRKSRFTENKSNHHKNKQRFMRTDINFVLGKNGGIMPRSLGSRSIVVVSE